jgi:hypothetical protein
VAPNDFASLRRVEGLTAAPSSVDIGLLWALDQGEVDASAAVEGPRLVMLLALAVGHPEFAISLNAYIQGQSPNGVIDWPILTKAPQSVRPPDGDGDGAMSPTNGAEGPPEGPASPSPGEAGSEPNEVSGAHTLEPGR